MLSNILRVLHTNVIIVGVLLCFQVVINIIQAHQVLQNMGAKKRSG